MRPRILPIAAALAAVLMAACGSGATSTSESTTGASSQTTQGAPSDASTSASVSTAPVATTASPDGAATSADAAASVSATPTRASAASTRASATTAAGSARGAVGQTLTVSRVRDLDPAGVTLTVSGRDYDESIGVYVALCVIPAPGQVPSPCGGGVDMSGASGASAWVSSSAPAYGQALAVPYQPGGDFTVRISVSARIGTIDCRTTACAVVTRADHLRTDDRSADVIVPVRFSRP